MLTKRVIGKNPIHMIARSLLASRADSKNVINKLQCKKFTILFLSHKTGGWFYHWNQCYEYSLAVASFLVPWASCQQVHRHIPQAACLWAVSEEKTWLPIKRIIYYWVLSTKCLKMLIICTVKNTPEFLITSKTRFIQKWSRPKQRQTLNYKVHIT